MFVSPVPPARTGWLRAALANAHDRTLALVSDLDEDHLIGPKKRTLTPPLWIAGHIGWFYDRYFLSHFGNDTASLTDWGEMFDPDQVAHPDLWDLRLPALAEVIDRKAATRDAVIAALGDGEMATPEQTALARFCVVREDMLSESLLMQRQTLSLPPPSFVDGGAKFLPGENVTGDISIPGGVHSLGAVPEDPFFMDNEKWGHGYEIDPFQIARTPVTNAEFQAFVDDGGYETESLWSPAGWGWRNYADAKHPVYWRQGEDGWVQRVFDEWRPLNPSAPICHVTWFEADAWCRWAGRRLPWEAEWEIAASLCPQSDDQIRGPKRFYPWGDEPPDTSHANLDGVSGAAIDIHCLEAGDSGYGGRQMIGNVWEWTQSVLSDYPGFVPGPWENYSKPFMDGNHPVLRGGSWATRSRAVWNNFRGFQALDRNDQATGFRTCAL